MSEVTYSVKQFLECDNGKFTGVVIRYLNRTIGEEVYKLVIKYYFENGRLHRTNKPAIEVTVDINDKRLIVHAENWIKGYPSSTIFLTFFTRLAGREYLKKLPGSDKQYTLTYSYRSETRLDQYDDAVRGGVELLNPKSIFYRYMSFGEAYLSVGQSIGERYRNKIKADTAVDNIEKFTTCNVFKDSEDSFLTVSDTDFIESCVKDPSILSGKLVITHTFTLKGHNFLIRFYMVSGRLHRTGGAAIEIERDNKLVFVENWSKGLPVKSAFGKSYYNCNIDNYTCAKTVKYDWLDIPIQHKSYGLATPIHLIRDSVYAAGVAIYRNSEIAKNIIENQVTKVIRSAIGSKPGTPTVELHNGTKEYYIKGKLSRKDGPAVEHCQGRLVAREWFVDGINYNCNGGPAVEYSDGSFEYTDKTGKFDRAFGPAIFYASTDTYYFYSEDIITRPSGPSVVDFRTKRAHFTGFDGNVIKSLPLNKIDAKYLDMSCVLDRLVLDSEQIDDLTKLSELFL